MNAVDVKRVCRRLLESAPVVAAALLTLSLLTIDLGAWAATDEQKPLVDTLAREGVLVADAEQFKKEAAKEEEQESKLVALPDVFKGLTIGVLGYIDYSAGEKGAAGNTQSSFNQFNLTRGYVTVQKTVTPWLAGRVTTDITRASDGSWNTRIKYLYVELKPHDAGFFTGMKAEFGQGHIPWLDFEEHINPYRCQGTMAIERAGVFNSADLGLSLQGSFGGKLEDAKGRTGNSHYAGRYGTWHVGVYNGGGYHASENNQNKVVEGRVTYRPLPDSVPGLQFSYLGVSGKGNVMTNAPDYSVNLGMLSYEHPSFIFTAQYFETKGNSGGSWVYAGNNALKTSDTSFFAAYHLPALENKLSLFARHDSFDADKDHHIAADATYDLTIVGLSYQLYKQNLVILDYEQTSYGNDSGGMGGLPVPGNNLGDDNRVQLVFQFAF